MEWESEIVFWNFNNDTVAASEPKECTIVLKTIKCKSEQQLSDK